VIAYVVTDIPERLEATFLFTKQLLPLLTEGADSPWIPGLHIISHRTGLLLWAERKTILKGKKGSISCTGSYRR